MLKSIIATAAVVCALGAFAAHADTTIIDCQTHDAVQEQADRDLAVKAFGVMKTHDMAAIDKLLPELQTALDRSPDKPSQPEHCGGTIIIYSNDMDDMLTLSAQVAQIPELAKDKVEQREALPYGSLAFIVGWIGVEHKEYATAERAYRKGLLIDPDDATLVSELSLCLAYQGESLDALRLIDSFLAAHLDLKDFDHALLLRKRGYALVELGRLDEGEAAYKESLIYAPGNATAQGELQYIQQQRAKSPKT